MKFRDKKPVTLDVDHMKLLHMEAIDQLELMQSALEAAEASTGTMRDSLDQMALNHWNAYMDIMHMIATQLIKTDLRNKFLNCAT